MLDQAGPVAQEAVDLAEVDGGGQARGLHEMRSVIGEHGHTRRPRAELAAKFPLCDFAPSLLPTEEDTLWTEELEAPEATAERGYRFLRWLAQRPETDIAVVAHGGLFHYLLNSLRPRVVASEAARQRFHNTELRSLSMEWADGAGGDAAPSEQGGEPPRTFKLDVVV